MAAPISAQAATGAIGTLKTATAGTMLVRNGKLMGAKGGQALLAGDKVMTRDGGTASLQLASGCNLAVPATSIMTVNGGADCNAAASGFAVNQNSFSTSNADALEGGSKAVLVGAGVGAAALGTYFVLHHNHHNQNVPPPPPPPPVSP